eukprot:TRINITY_DN24393_c0_g1_i1.p1 TRINITY_DN24393_c0_g1~~TRINITY_DN24393_c0_g1_i1.p1  ORF type:complete len:108 (-),score=13.82 TRINITY_DN24393_c0_g1_i1:69-392(-)
MMMKILEMIYVFGMNGMRPSFSRWVVWKIETKTDILTSDSKLSTLLACKIQVENKESRVVNKGFIGAEYIYGEVGNDICDLCYCNGEFHSRHQSLSWHLSQQTTLLQ